MSDDPNAVPPPRNDNATPRAEAMAHAFVANLVGGLRFYSRLPIGFVPHTAPELNRIAPVLPLVSLLLGLGPAVLMVVLTLCGLPSVYAAGIAVAVSLVLTGAMAEDALADACDGLFGGTTPERRLEIMRDSRHGTYGVSALVLLLLLRTLAVGGIAAVHPFAGAAAWLASGIVARSASLWLPLALTPARSDGASAAAGRVGAPAFWFGAAVAAVLSIVLATPFAGITGAIVALFVAVGLVVMWTRLCRSLIGGHTGDCVGALQALVEIGMLSVFFAFA